jgi:hypothetical protein
MPPPPRPAAKAGAATATANVRDRAVAPKIPSFDIVLLQVKDMEQNLSVDPSFRYSGVISNL